MQCLAIKLLQGFAQFAVGSRWQPDPASVEFVTDQGKSSPTHVNPDLVSSAGFQLSPDQAVVAELALHANMGHGGLAGGGHAHSQAILPMPANGLIDFFTGHHYAVDHRQVVSAHAVILKLPDQALAGNLAARNHQQSGSILVQPVYDAGAWQGTKSFINGQ